jgi:hypothetical protein
MIRRLANDLREAADHSCDPDAVALLLLAAVALERCSYRGVCLICGKFMANRRGECAPCRRARKRDQPPFPNAAT